MKFILDHLFSANMRRKYPYLYYMAQFHLYVMPEDKELKYQYEK